MKSKVKKPKRFDLIEILLSPEDKRMTILIAANKGKIIWKQAMEIFNVRENDSYQAQPACPALTGSGEDG